ncbi:hypothetical protein Tco_0721379 [Tanacetum coccineum]
MEILPDVVGSIMRGHRWAVFRVLPGGKNMSKGNEDGGGASRGYTMFPTGAQWRCLLPSWLWCGVIMPRGGRRVCALSFLWLVGGGLEKGGGRASGKLCPHYIGPFKILARVGPVAYTLELPKELQGIHSTFHVSNLNKCLADENLIIPLDEIQLDHKLYFIEEPMEIIDQEVKRLKQSRIPIIKVRWNSRRGPEFTWECEDQFRDKYPHLFAGSERADKSN